MIQYRSMYAVLTRYVITGGLLAVLPSFTGCSEIKPTRVILYEDAFELIAMEPIPGDITARHPVTIEPRVMTAILRGLYLHEDEHPLQSLLAGRMPPSPVFSADQVHRLAHHLVPALAKVSPRQQLRFRVRTPGQADETEGTLYCTTPFLHLTLERFHGGSPQAPVEDPHRQLPREAPHHSRRLVFQFPLEAGPIVIDDGPTTVAVDYARVKRWIAEHDGFREAQQPHSQPSVERTLTDR